MKARLIAAGVILVVVIGGWWLYPIVAFVHYSAQFHREAENKITALPADRLDQLRRDAEKLASAGPTDEILRDDAIPTELIDLGPRSVFIKSDEVIIEFLGGMDHVGLAVRKSGGRWSVYRYAGDGNSRDVLIK